MDNSVLRETQDRAQKLSRFLLPASVLIGLLMVAAVGAYTWYYVFKPCEVNVVKEASALLVGRMNFYDEAYQFATTASRTSLVLQ